MNRAILATNPEIAPAPKAKTSSTAASSGLRIGDPDDSFEREADRAADEVMTGSLGRDWSFSKVSIGTPLQRKCSCGGSSASGGECEECKDQKKNTLQRKAWGTRETGFAPLSVHRVLNSPGQPLDPATRDFFEPRFGYDFSGVRVHTDSEAAEAARTVHALAFAVGRDVAMGSGQYAPDTDSGRRLLAHELAHVVQQGASPRPVLARACMTADECAHKTEQTPEELMQQQTSDPANKSKRDQRRLACNKPHPDPSCTADGHGARAVQLEKVLRDFDPTRLRLIKRIVVDKDMESGFDGLTGPCSDLMPPVHGGGLCTSLPDHFETEAAQFNNTQDLTIAAQPRDLWRTNILRILEHETEHARFDAVNIAAPRPGACKFQDIFDSLTEIAAMLAEFPEVFRSSNENVSFTPEQRQQVLDDWFSWRIPDKDQSFKSTLHSIYCKCECADSDAYVKKTIDFTTAKWSQAEKARFNGEMHDPKWASHNLRWPVQPPPVPTAAPSPSASPAPSPGGHP
jgi:uncharacterized protein DUF4157